MPEIFEGYDPDMSGDLSNAGGIIGAIFRKKDKDKNKDKDDDKEEK